MRLGILFSGGKDSNYVLYRAKKEGHEVPVLINVVSGEDSYLFHTINYNIVDLQAKALDIPLERIYTNVEREYEDLIDALRNIKEKYSLEGIGFGVIKSRYQYKKFSKIFEEMNLYSFTPLWMRDEEEYLYELINMGFKVIISGFFAYPFDKSLLGKELDEKIVKYLKELNEKYKINMAGEGGEIETTVLYQPYFGKKIVIDKYKEIIGNNYGIFKIEEAHLEDI